MFRCSKCQTCKFFSYIDVPPWGKCKYYKNNIPLKFIELNADEKEKCSNYKYNPNWDKCKEMK